MIILHILGLVFFVTFMLIVFRGAPYVPTKRADVTKLFDELSLGDKDVIVDLGSGDGRLLLEAAKRGISSVGYELNPFLVLVSWMRLRKYEGRARVAMRDFWLTYLPKRTKVVFVFLGTPFMKKLDNYLLRQMQHRDDELLLVSYGVPVPGREPVRETGAFLVYAYKKP